MADLKGVARGNIMRVVDCMGPPHPFYGTCPSPYLLGYSKITTDLAIQALKGKLIFKMYINAKEWLADASTVDLILLTHIQGSTVGFSTGAPTVVIPADHRIQELANSMHLPHLTLEDLSIIPTSGSID